MSKNYFFQNQGIECWVYINCGDGVTIVCIQPGWRCQSCLVAGGEIYPKSLVKQASLKDESEYTAPQIFASYFLKEALKKITPEDKKPFAGCFGIR